VGARGAPDAGPAERAAAAPAGASRLCAILRLEPADAAGGSSRPGHGADRDRRGSGHGGPAAGRSGAVDPGSRAARRQAGPGTGPGRRGYAVAAGGSGHPSGDPRGADAGSGVGPARVAAQAPPGAGHGSGLDDQRAARGRAGRRRPAADAGPQGRAGVRAGAGSAATLCPRGAPAADRSQLAGGDARRTPDPGGCRSGAGDPAAAGRVGDHRRRARIEPQGAGQHRTPGHRDGVALGAAGEVSAAPSGAARGGVDRGLAPGSEPHLARRVLGHSRGASRGRTGPRVAAVARGDGAHRHHAPGGRRGSDDHHRPEPVQGGARASRHRRRAQAGAALQPRRAAHADAARGGHRRDAADQRPHAPLPSGGAQRHADAGARLAVAGSALARCSRRGDGVSRDPGASRRAQRQRLHRRRLLRCAVDPVRRWPAAGASGALLEPAAGAGGDRAGAGPGEVGPPALVALDAAGHRTVADPPDPGGDAGGLAAAAGLAWPEHAGGVAPQVLVQHASDRDPVFDAGGDRDSGAGGARGAAGPAGHADPGQRLHGGQFALVPGSCGRHSGRALDLLGAAVRLSTGDAGLGPVAGLRRAALAEVGLGHVQPGRDLGPRAASTHEACAAHETATTDGATRACLAAAARLGMDLAPGADHRVCRRRSRARAWMSKSFQEPH